MRFFKKVYNYLFVYLFGYLMFDPQRPLKDIIFELIGSDGKSISALSRELESNGITMHKLILTGYLRALSDLNLLKEKDIPPSKLYIPVKTKNLDIYGLVGECSRNICSGSEADLLVLHTFCKLFKRAVFMDELKKAGIKDQPNLEQASKEDKQEAKKILQRTNMKNFDSNIAYIYYNEEKFKDMYEDLLSQILSQLVEISQYSKQTKQTTLFEI